MRAAGARFSSFVKRDTRISFFVVRFSRAGVGLDRLALPAKAR